MEIDFISRLIGLVERSNVAELDLTLDGARLRLVKSRAGGAVLPPPLPAAAQPLPVEAPRSAAPASPALHAVRAGFPGTFYRSPAPGAPPFVEEGARVADGTQLGILEAMKTMNPVESDIAGTLRRISLADASPVETGDVLFEIEPDA